MLLQHIQYNHNSTGLKSLHKPIADCFKLNKDSYNKSIQCIENVTFSKEEYINTDHSKGFI